MFMNCIPIFIEPYISRFSVDQKSQEGTTPDYSNFMLPTNSEIHNISIRFSNLNFHCPIFNKNTVGDRTFSVKRILIGTNYPLTLKLLNSLKRNIFYMNFITKQRPMGNFKYICTYSV